MNYLLANKVSGRILSLVERNGEEDSTVEVPDSDFVLCYQENCTPNVAFTKYWNNESKTIMNKTEMFLVYSHPHTEKDFFSETMVSEAGTVGKAVVGSWDNDEIDLCSTSLQFNDDDEIRVPVNTIVTISNIPLDADTTILVNGQPVPVVPSIDVNSAVNTVTIDSPKYFIKTIRIVEEV